MAMVDETIVEVVSDWIDNAYTKGRTATVFFCVSVQHAEKMTQYLKQYGISSAVITGETPSKERSQTLADFESV